MSWCGGGEIRPTPGVEYLVRAIHGYTLCPGSWPPSPGLAPWAILICRSLALTRYSLVTPNRPLATCLTAERRRSPFGVGDEALRVLAALAGVGPAAEAVHRDRQGLVRLGRDRAVGHRPGGEAPHDRGDRLHLVEGTGGAGARASPRASTPRIRSRPRSVISRAAWSSTSLVYSAKISWRRLRVACCSLNTVSRAEQVRLALAPPLVLAAGLQPPVRGPGAAGREGPGVPRGVSAASSSKPTPPRRDGVPAKQALDDLVADPDRLEDLGAGVRGDRGDAHLGHDLQQRPCRAP